MAPSVHSDLNLFLWKHFFSIFISLISESNHKLQCSLLNVRAPLRFFTKNSDCFKFRLESLLPILGTLEYLEVAALISIFDEFTFFGLWSFLVHSFQWFYVHNFHDPVCFLCVGQNDSYILSKEYSFDVDDGWFKCDRYQKCGKQCQ